MPNKYFSVSSQCVAIGTDPAFRWECLHVLFRKKGRTGNMVCSCWLSKSKKCRKDLLKSLKNIYFLQALVSKNIWCIPLIACVCLHMKATGEAHLSTRQHIKAFFRWSERPPALGLLDLSPVCLETGRTLHLRGCDGASEFMNWK